MIVIYNYLLWMRTWVSSEVGLALTISGWWKFYFFCFQHDASLALNDSKGKSNLCEGEMKRLVLQTTNANKIPGNKEKVSGNYWNCYFPHCFCFIGDVNSPQPVCIIWQEKLANTRAVPLWTGTWKPSISFTLRNRSGNFKRAWDLKWR